MSHMTTSYESHDDIVSSDRENILFNVVFGVFLNNNNIC